MSEIPEEPTTMADPTVEPPPRVVGEFDPERVIYLSGPMTGYPEYNYPAFEEAATALRNAGATVLSPHENAWPADADQMNPEELWETMMRAAIRQMNGAHDLVLMQGWTTSKGSRYELDYMLTRHTDVKVWFYKDYLMTLMSKEA